ncbi:MAG: recombinase [Herminiimonas sp.]|nr:recombinase [Herminiimonas sp.]
MLMEYVGWKNINSAMRYIDSPDPFGKHRTGASLMK